MSCLINSETEFLTYIKGVYVGLTARFPFQRAIGDWYPEAFFMVVKTDIRHIGIWVIAVYEAARYQP